jgi:hypothetical protein
MRSPTPRSDFRTAAQYRIEIPGTEGPRCLEAVIGEAERLAVRVHRIVYVEVPDTLGGFVRLHEIPELIRVAAPIYVKFGLRGAPDIYPSGSTSGRRRSPCRGSACAVRGSASTCSPAPGSIRSCRSSGPRTSRCP